MTRSEMTGYTYKKMSRQLGVIAILMLVGMTIYEILKQLVSPEITIWQSHFVTIVFSTFSATTVSFFILKKHIRLSREVLKKKDESDELREDLKKAYAVIEGIIESSENVVIFALDPRYRYISFNKNHQRVMRQIWGVNIALGHCMLDYIANPDDREKAKNNFDRALSGESFTVEEEYGDTGLERRFYQNLYNPIADKKGNVIGLSLILTDITDRKRIERQREKLIVELQKSLAEIKELRGILPICSSCKKIRDDKGYWTQIESYIGTHSYAQFSHGICPDCAKELYGDLYEGGALRRNTNQPARNGS